MTQRSRRAFSSLLTAVLFSALVAACGGDDGGSGVSRSKKFGELNLEEAKALCQSQADSLEDPFTVIDCYSAAIQDNSTDAMACESAAQDCLATPPAGSALDCDVTQEDLDELPDCANEVTVGEVEDCFADQAADIQDYADNLSCTNIPPQPEQPASCQAVEEKCPGLAGGDSSAVL